MCQMPSSNFGILRKSFRIDYKYSEDLLFGIRISKYGETLFDVLYLRTIGKIRVGRFGKETKA